MKQNVKLSRGEIVWLKYALVSYIETKQEDIDAIELANSITGTEKLSPEQEAAVNRINDEIKRLWSIHATLETYVTGGFVKGGLPKMGYVSKEYLKENGYMLFRYQKSEDGSEGVLPVNIDDLPETDGIIHCKDCEHWKLQIGNVKGDGLGSCDFHNANLVTGEGFCYWADRRDEENEQRH